MPCFSLSAGWLFLAYQTPTAVATKVGTPTAIPMISEVSSPEELEAEVGAGLEDEFEVGFCVEGAGAAESLDGVVEVMVALAKAAGSGYSVI